MHMHITCRILEVTGTLWIQCKSAGQLACLRAKYLGLPGQLVRAWQAWQAWCSPALQNVRV